MGKTSEWIITLFSFTTPSEMWAGNGTLFRENNSMKNGKRKTGKKKKKRKREATKILPVVCRVTNWNFQSPQMHGSFHCEIPCVLGLHRKLGARSKTSARTNEIRCSLAVLMKKIYPSRSLIHFVDFNFLLQFSISYTSLFHKCDSE